MNKTILIVKLFIVLLIFQLQQGFSQNKKIVDSLTSILQMPLPDTTRIKSTLELAYEYRYSKPDTSMIILKEAHQIALKTKDKGEIAKCLTEMGYVFWVQTKFDSAINMANQSQQLNSKEINKKTAARSLQLYGMCYRDIGNYPLALENLFHAMELNETIGNKREIANCQNNIGEIYKFQGNLTTGLDYYMKALELRKEINDKHGLARIYNNIAEIFILQKDYENALKYSFESLKVCQEIKNQLRISQNYAAIAELYLIQKQIKLAVKYAKLALNLNELINNQRGKAENHNLLASVYYENKNFSDASKNAEQALKLANALHLLSVTRSASLMLFHIYKDQQDFKTALFYNELVQNTQDSMFSIEKNKKIEQIKYGFEIDKKQKELELSEKDKRIAIHELSQQRLILLSFAGGFFSLVLISMNIFRSNKKLNASYKIVTHQKNEILEKNEVLSQLNEEITAQRDEIEVQKNEIELRNVQLVKYKTNITDSISYASKIQQALLSSSEILSTVFPDQLIFFKPRDIVSGDFYWFYQYNDFIFIAVADCTGHGVPGAFMSVLGMTILNETVDQQKILQPNLVLNELRDRIIQSLGQTGKAHEAKDGMDIAVAVINTKEMTMQFSGANIPAFIFRKNENSFEFIEIKGDKMPIGIYAHLNKEFSMQEFSLLKDDVVYLSSDGFHSQFGGEKGEKLKKTQFKNLLQSICNLPMAQQHEMLENFLIKWKGKMDQIDDIMVVGVRIG